MSTTQQPNFIPVSMTDRIDFLTWQEVLDQLLSLLPPQWRANFTGKVLKRLLVAFSLSLEALYALLAKVLRLAIISTSEGQWLRSLVAGFGMNAYAGIPAAVTLKFERFGSVDTVVSIPAGSEVQAENGTSFTTNEAATLAVNQYFVLVPATCTLPGIAGNIPANTTLGLKTAIQGISQVTNPNPGVGGDDAESDASIRSRVPTYLAMLHRATIPATEGVIADPTAFPEIISFTTERRAGLPGYFRGVVQESSAGSLFRPGVWVPATGIPNTWYTIANQSTVSGLVEMGWPCKRFGEVAYDNQGKEVWNPSATAVAVGEGDYRWYFDAPTKRLYANAGGKDPNTLSLTILAGVLWQVLQTLEDSWVANGIHVDVVLADS